MPVNFNGLKHQTKILRGSSFKYPTDILVMSLGRERFCFCLETKQDHLLNCFVTQSLLLELHVHLEFQKTFVHNWGSRMGSVVETLLILFLAFVL